MRTSLGIPFDFFRLLSKLAATRGASRNELSVVSLLGRIPAGHTMKD